MALTLGISGGGVGTPGPEGPPGPMGPEGPPGPAGPPGPGSGPPEVVARLEKLDGSLAISQTTLFTPPATGVFRISLYLVVVAAVSGATGEVRAGLFWMDDATIGRVVETGGISIPNLGYTQLSLVAQLKGGTPLQYNATVFNNAAGNRTWQLHIVVEEM